MRSTHLVLASSFTAAAIVFACSSYGNYDGSFVGDAGSGDGEAGTVVLTKTIGPSSREELRTPDGALVVLFSAGSFDAPATVTITRLADRLLNETNPPLIVPAYVISADKEPLLPFQVAFTGNNPNPGQVLAVARVAADGNFAPTPLVGSEPTGQGGNTGSAWGVARNFGTFSLIFRQVDNAFYDVASNSCMAKCCNRTGVNGNGNVGAVGGSCFCSAPPALECLLQNCPSTIAAEIQRCVENASTGQPPPSCRPSSCTNGCNYPGMNCATNQTCCINQRMGQCTGQQMGGLSSAPCQGIAIRCDLGTTCPNGTTCCVFDTEAYCASSCPNERTWCSTGSPCADGGACTPAPNCPYGTCGTPPAACTN